MDALRQMGNGKSETRKGIQRRQSGRLREKLEVLNGWRYCEKRSHDPAPFGKCLGLSETHGMVFQRGPEDLQHVTLWRFNALVDLEAMKSLRVRDHFACTTFNGFFKCGVLTCVDADVGNLENHGVSVVYSKANDYASGMANADSPRFDALPEDWLVADWPAPANVRACCTTRAAGISGGVYGSMNLGLHVGDVPADVMTNRQLLGQFVQAKPMFLEQMHQTELVSLRHDMADGVCADAASTDSVGLACVVMVADCLPVLLCDTIGKSVAAAHAGWRGLLGQSGHGVIESAVDSFGVDAAHGYVLAWLGPCVGPNAFEVGPEVRAAYLADSEGAATHFKPIGGGKWLADLPALARSRLRARGVSQIYGNDGSPAWCTVSNPSRFFSHRRDGVSGRMAACIWRVN
jgi:YfiH family protein